MAEKLEGTYQLDGLLEGPAPQGEILARLRGWAAYTATRDGLNFNVEIHGDSFQVLPDDGPMDVPAHQEPSDRVRAALEDLLSALTPPQRAGVQSTIRSSEYRPGAEVQTVYVVQPDGKVRTEQRTVATTTTPRPVPLTTRRRLVLGGAALAVVALAVGVGSLFFDYGALWDRMMGRGGPLDEKRTKLDLGSFSEYLLAEKLTSQRGGGEAVLRLKRTGQFPLTDAQFAAALETETGKTLRGRLALEALARGYVRCEFLAEDGKLLGWAWLPIGDLQEKDALDAPLKAPSRDAVHALRLRP